MGQIFQIFHHFFAATDRDIAVACSIRLLDWACFLCIEQLFLPCFDRVWWGRVCFEWFRQFGILEREFQFPSMACQVIIVADSLQVFSSVLIPLENLHIPENISLTNKDKSYAKSSQVFGWVFFGYKCSVVCRIFHDYASDTSQLYRCTSLKGLLVVCCQALIKIY